MKQFLIVVLGFVTSVSACTQPREQKLNEYMEAANQNAGFNGCALVAKDGKILLEKGYGYRDAASKTLHDSNSIFQIGSVTKQFTAILILQLQQQGKLSVNDKLSKYFPQYQYADKITIKNLLNHTSGIYNYTNDEDFMSNHITEYFSEATLWKMIKDKPLDFEPGSKFNYSNSGYLLLGYIAEKVSGRPYEALARDLLFNKAGMANSGYDFTHLKSPNKSTGYFTKDLNAKAPIVDSSVSFSAGAVYSTIEDLYKWNTALNTYKIVPKNVLETAYEPFKEKYGYGFFIDSTSGKRRIMHGGGIHGFTSQLTYIPADKVTIVILCNNSGDVSKLNNDLLAIIYGQPYKKAELLKEIQADTSVLKQYTGEYELTPAFKITIAYKDGKLTGQATGQPSFELFAKDQKTFFLKAVDAQIEFVKNAEGKTESMILHQGGQNIPGKKVK
jgi:CubicO group peptidase (beta-lactamase class C family)